MASKQLSANFLTKIRLYPNLPSQTWYYITLIALSVCNKPELISSVVSHAFKYNSIPGSTDAAYVKQERAWLARNPGKIGQVDDEGRESALRILRKCREGLVKSGVIGGIPKAINSLYHLRKCHEPHLLDPFPEYISSSSTDASSTLSLHPLSSTYPTSRPFSLSPSTISQVNSSNNNPEFPFFTRGSHFFNTLYGSLSNKVLNNLSRSSPDLHVLATWVYALFLSENTIQAPKETSFTIVAALIPQDVNAQLKPHLQGGINNGATKEEMESVRGVVIEICKEVGVGWTGEVAKL